MGNTPACCQGRHRRRQGQSELQRLDQVEKTATGVQKDIDALEGLSIEQLTRMLVDPLNGQTAANAQQRLAQELQVSSFRNDQAGLFDALDEQDAIRELEAGRDAPDDEKGDMHLTTYADGVCVCCVNSAYSAVRVRLYCSVM